MNILRYNFCMILFAMLLLPAAWSADFQAVLEPSTVMEGETFALQLISRGKDRAELLETPKNFPYRGSSQSTNIVNGSRTNIMGYQFVAPAPGKYKLPKLKVKMGKKEYTTDELELVVVKDSAAQLGTEDVFARAELDIKRKKIYVGEDISLRVNVYYPQKVRLQLAYPVLDAGKSVFRDFRNVNAENPAFGQVRRSRKVLDEKLFEEVSFPTAFRPLAPGKLTVTGQVPCNILVPERRRSRDPFDDFFGGSSNYRRIPRQLKVEIKDIDVLPLPPVPAKSVFLGLVGKYSISCQLDRETVSALEPVSLNIKIVSSTPLETVEIPELSLPGCRVYPGELRNTADGAVISYAIIPLQAGKVNIEKTFCYFDPEMAQYVPVGFKKILPVTPSQLRTAPAPAPAAAPVSAAAQVDLLADKTGDAVVRSTLLYCKKAPESGSMQFFRRNRILLVWILFAAGPLLWLLGSLCQKYLPGRQRDARQKRSDKAAAMRSKLYSKVDQSSAADLVQLASGEVANYLSDRWQLPPGVTLEDIAAAAEDPELSAALRECSNVSYLPPELAQSAVKDPEQLRKVLLRALKCVVLVLALGCMSLEAAEVKDWKSALQAYEKGDYQSGKAFFDQYARENPADPNVLYNLGCFAEASGDQEGALYLMESAGLMAPMDSAIHENRNVMRRKFFLPEVGKNDTPAELVSFLRDRLHPESYLLLAAAAWFAFFVIMLLRRKLNDTLRWSLIAVCAVIFVLSLVLALSQYHTTYRSGQALVVTKNAELYTFPGVHNGKKVGTLSGGTPVNVIEEQTDYSLVSANDMEGWTANKNIRKLLSH